MKKRSLLLYFQRKVNFKPNKRALQKFKMDSCCGGGRHRSTSIKIVGDITSKRSNVIFGHCSICNREQCMTVSENTTATENLDDFSKNLGKKRCNCIKKDGKKRFEEAWKSSGN